MIKFTWWEIYLIAWAVAGPSIFVSLLLLWELPQWWEFDYSRWLWGAITLLLIIAGPFGVLWVTLAVGPDGFLARSHAYGTVEFLAYQWLPGLLTLPAIILAGLFAWQRWCDAETCDQGG